MHSVRQKPTDQNLYRRNYLFHYVDGSLFVFAMSIVSLQTVVPVFIRESGGGMISVGLFPLLWGIGISLPQLFFQPGAGKGFIKKTMLQFALLHRLTFLLMALLCFLVLPYTQNNSAVIVLFFMTLAAFSGSFAIPTWLHFFAKTVEIPQRGRLLSIRQFTGSLMGIGAGVYIASILGKIPFPYNYGLLFFTTFVIMMISWWALSSVKEQTEVFEEKLALHPIKAGLQLIHEDRSFRNYLFTDMIGQWISTITSFLPVYAMAKFHAGAETAGGFTSLLMLGMIIINPILGYLADKKGHKINVVLYHVFTALTCLAAIASPNLYVFGVVFLFSAVAQAVLGISRIGIVLEMSSETNRRRYVSAVATFSSVFVVSGVVHGFLIGIVGYEPVFVFDAVLGIIGAVILQKKVAEPRGSATKTSI